MSDEGLLLEPGAGSQASARGFGVTFKVGSDRAGGASCIELTFAPGVQTGKHVHRRLEETFYVLDGELSSSKSAQRRSAVGLARTSSSRSGCHTLFPTEVMSRRAVF